ncbi:MAG: DUF3710 domain-containing protein [Corynebacterium sp.]|nr:DUF3710 domain-containing protein [Corynebacterium sp.]
MSSHSSSGDSGIDLDLADGPYDGETIGTDIVDFSDFAAITLDLGSLRLPLPDGAEVQVEMGERGPKVLHIITPFGRITPVGFAAARSGSLWSTSYQDILDSMRRDGMSVRIDDGPWGVEVVGEASEATLRVIGVDGARWMVRFSCTAPTEYALELSALARAMLSRTVINRGDKPMPDGATLPISVPTSIADQIRAALLQPEPPAAPVPTPVAPPAPVVTHGLFDYTDDMTNGSAIQQMTAELKRPQVETERHSGRE